MFISCCRANKSSLSHTHTYRPYISIHIQTVTPNWHAHKQGKNLSFTHFLSVCRGVLVPMTVVYCCELNACNPTHNNTCIHTHTRTHTHFIFCCFRISCPWNQVEHLKQHLTLSCFPFLSLSLSLPISLLPYCSSIHLSVSACLSSFFTSVSFSPVLQVSHYKTAGTV